MRKLEFKEAELKSPYSGKGRRHTQWTGGLCLASKPSAEGGTGCEGLLSCVSETVQSADLAQTCMPLRKLQFRSQGYTNSTNMRQDISLWEKCRLRKPGREHHQLNALKAGGGFMMKIEP